MTRVLGELSATLRRVEKNLDAEELREATLGEVAARVDRFFEVVRSSDTDDAQAAFDTVAAWADLWRTRPALIAEVVGVTLSEGRDLFKDRWADVLGMKAFVEAEQLLRRRLPELVRLALRVLRPARWVEELEEFVDVTLEGELDTSQWAKDLLCDLDAAELVLSVARLTGVDVPERVELGMRFARGALQHEAEAFIGVRRWFTARALAVELERPAHRELAASAAWHLPLLREVLLFETWRRGEGPVDPGAQSAAVELFRAWETLQQGPDVVCAKPSVSAPALESPLSPDPMREQIASWLRRAEERAAAPSMVAEIPSEPQYPRICGIRWYSGDKRFVAVLHSPDAEHGTVDLRIHHCFPLPKSGCVAAGPPATELAGASVSLRGVKACVAEDGRARFPLKELRAAFDQPGAAGDLNLLIDRGDAGQESWQAAEP